MARFVPQIAVGGFSVLHFVEASKLFIKTHANGNEYVHEFQEEPGHPKRVRDGYCYACHLHAEEMPPSVCQSRTSNSRKG